MDEVDGLLHPRVDSVAKEPDDDGNDNLAEVIEEGKVGRNTCWALQLPYITEAVTINSSWDVKKNTYYEERLVVFKTQEV